MGRRPPTGRQLRNFTQSQIQLIQKAFLNEKGVLPDRSFFQKLAKEINVTSGLTGKKAIHWGQLKKWHQQHLGKAYTPAVMLNAHDILPDVSLPINAPESSAEINKEQEAAEVPELEARSCRDGAWYDVASILEQRIDSLGELEVCVRYEGFGPEEDEWVNLKNAVRARSIPLEPTECCNVAVGDLVLCFWEHGESAVYFDAHVLDIERKLHDIRGCRCVFSIRYDHDQTEERVQLKRLCRRP